MAILSDQGWHITKGDTWLTPNSAEAHIGDLSRPGSSVRYWAAWPWANHFYFPPPLPPFSSSVCPAFAARFLQQWLSLAR